VGSLIVNSAVAVVSSSKSSCDAMSTLSCNGGRELLTCGTKTGDSRSDDGVTLKGFVQALFRQTGKVPATQLRLTFGECFACVRLPTLPQSLGTLPSTKSHSNYLGFRTTRSCRMKPRRQVLSTTANGLIVRGSSAEIESPTRMEAYASIRHVLPGRGRSDLSFAQAQARDCTASFLPSSTKVFRHSCERSPALH